MVVYPKVIETHVNSELTIYGYGKYNYGSCKKEAEIDKSFMKKLEFIQWKQQKELKDEGLDNDLIDRIINDASFELDEEEF